MIAALSIRYARSTTRAPMRRGCVNGDSVTTESSVLDKVRPYWWMESRLPGMNSISYEVSHIVVNDVWEQIRFEIQITAVIAGIRTEV